MKTRSTLLTQEERDILILATLHPGGRHLTNSEIGQRRGISVTRVKTLIHQACIKLGADNRNAAILAAMRRGEISITQLLSLDELADILSSLGADTLRRIATIMRQAPEPGHPPGNDEPIIRVDRREDGILTNRERDVLVLAAQGLTNQEIADKLCMSTSAVRTFFNRACTKLGAHKRTDALVRALKQREISIGEISSLDQLLRDLAPFGPEAIEQMADLVNEKLGQEPPLTGS